LAPHQVRIIPVNRDAHGKFAKDLADRLIKQGIRAEYEDRNEKLGYLIRDAQTSKVPYTLVIGDEEVNNNTVTIRRFGSTDTKSKSVDAFEAQLMADIARHSRAMETLEKAVKG